MAVVDAQVHIWSAETPELPWHTALPSWGKMSCRGTWMPLTSTTVSSSRHCGKGAATIWRWKLPCCTQIALR
jgi:hypothetical protein